MDRSNIIYLVKEIAEQDENYQFQITETKRQVYCDVRSVTGTEWFEAGRAGMQPAYAFIMFAPDYDDEKIIEYNGRRYGVYRTYIGRNERIELYAEEKGGLVRDPEGTVPSAGVQETPDEQHEG